MLEKVLNRLQPSTSNEDVPWLRALRRPGLLCLQHPEAQVIFEEAQQLVESMRFPKARPSEPEAANL